MFLLSIENVSEKSIQQNIFQNVRNLRICDFRKCFYFFYVFIYIFLYIYFFPQNKHFCLIISISINIYINPFNNTSVIYYKIFNHKKYIYRTADKTLKQTM